jgi:hypothetical protein
MGEQDMINAVQRALDDRGIDDRIEECGQFEPRGQSGSIAAGGLLGSELGDGFGDVGSAIGLGAGVLGGMKANSASRGLPRNMLVGASESTVYGFHMGKGGRRSEPRELLFRVPRNDLEVKVHGRVNVRVLELIEPSTGTKVELEGSRIPITHSHDLIKFLVGAKAADQSDAEAADQGEKLSE